MILGKRVYMKNFENIKIYQEKPQGFCPQVEVAAAHVEVGNDTNPILIVHKFG